MGLGGAGAYPDADQSVSKIHARHGNELSIVYQRVDDWRDRCSMIDRRTRIDLLLHERPRYERATSCARSSIQNRESSSCKAAVMDTAAIT